jgi:tryptophanyl-tRNA synthetase
VKSSLVCQHTERDDKTDNENALKEYRAGRLLTSELKNLTIEVLQKFVKEFQDASRAPFAFA